MKKSFQRVMLCLPGVLLALATVSCGTSEHIVEACRVQESESDCIELGNNILILSEDTAGYQCVWTGTSCTSKLL